MVRIEQLQGWTKRLPVEKLLWAGVVALSVLLAQQAARLTWQFVAPIEMDMASWQPGPARPASGGAEPGVDLRGILELSLFGTYQPPQQARAVPQQVVSAPKTRLRLNLAGVVASSEPSRSIAIIASGGNQESYGIGDSINGTQARLHQVFPDRVILDNSGTLETLYLDEEQEGERTARRSVPREAPARSRVSEERAELLSNPAKLTELVNISPVQRDGELVGYRVNPGKDPELFREVGLEPNDLAVSINGYDLTDNEQAMQMLAELPELTELTIMVEREGQLHQVFISIQQ